MDATLAVARSGLQVQVNRLAASANNVANASSTGAVPDSSGQVPAGKPAAYQPTTAVSVASASGATTGYQRPSPTTFTQYQPDSPLADDSGSVEVPNVDDVQEATTRLSAHRAYSTNLAVVRTSDQMFRTLLDTAA